ncbi:MAG: septum formation protein Maf [Clostridia bacterium]|nr:septum formation protein Maf [Clostridia bacterium]
MINNVILASKSPRRHELLSMLGFGIKTVVSDVDEDLITADTPALLASKLAHTKALAVANEVGTNDLPIIAADTLVEVNGEILGKPKDAADARRMLKMLSGSVHYVHTGISVIYRNNEINLTDTAKVFFRDIDEDELDAYIASQEPFDKAGAYGIQGKAGAFVERIEGDFFSIMGLPICAVTKALKQLTKDDNT